MTLLVPTLGHWPNSPTSLLLSGFLLLLAGYALTVVVYNLFLHPLRRFPGPFWAKVSNEWSRYHNLYGRRSEKIHAAHLRHGPVVRIGPNQLSFAHPAAVRDIYTSKVFHKEDRFYRAKRIFHEDQLLSFRDPEAHNQRRKLLSRGFSQGAMLEFEPHMASKIKILLDQWAKRTADGSPINIYPWCHMLGFDTVYHLMFDDDPCSVAKGEEHEIMRYLRSWRPTFIYKEIVPQLQQWGPYIPGSIGGYFRDVQTWKNYAMKLVVGFRKNGTKTPFLSRVLDGEDAFLHRPLTDSELAEECMGGIFGGSGSTANTFIYLLWACLSHPEVLQRLKAELKEAFPDRDVMPDYRTCSKLSYLEAVVNETMRRYPMLVAQLPRVATVDAFVDGVHVPKGTIVGTQNYTIHRSETAFPDPEEFRPERWLSKDDSAMKEAFTPFSIGQRKCIGLNLAEMELRILSAAFFLRFDASIDASMMQDDMRMYDMFNASPAGAKLWLRLKEET